MTKMNKKFGLIVSLCLVIIMSVCGCGKETKTYQGYTGDELAMTNQALMTNLIQIPEDELQQMLSDTSTIYGPYVNMITQWSDIMYEVGSFVDFTDTEVVESNDTLTVAQTCQFSERDVTLTLVYEADNIEAGPTDATIDKVYTLGETMAKAGMNTLMGLFTVFLMLIVISLIISCFTLINKAQKKAEEKKQTPVTDQVVEQIQQREEQTGDELELVAVIAAAIAAATGQTTDDFVVRSIKRR